MAMPRRPMPASASRRSTRRWRPSKPTCTSTSIWKTTFSSRGRSRWNRRTQTGRTPVAATAAPPIKIRKRLLKRAAKDRSQTLRRPFQLALRLRTLHRPLAYQSSQQYPLRADPARQRIHPSLIAPEAGSQRTNSNATRCLPSATGDVQVLCVIIDDHSRLIVYAAYFLRADTQAFLQTLKEALRRRGLPAKLYTDQGGPFTNDHTRVVCANLGIRLLHAKPYHAWSKGKVERVIFTIQQDFEAGLRLPGQGAGSLVELNTQFSLWLQSVYHTRVHSSTGMTPAERYQRGAHLVKALDPHLDLDQLFYHQLTRTVRRDGTVRLGNLLYEVDLSLRTLSVQLRFDSFKLDRIEVSYRGTAFGLAKRVNAQLNSQIQGGDAYEKRP